MLVLAAVYKSHLQNYLPPDTKLTRTTLSNMYKRTIKVLNGMSDNSPVLLMVRDILIHIQREIDLDVVEQPKHRYGSNAE